VHGASWSASTQKSAVSVFERRTEGQYLAAGDVEDAHQIHKPWAIGKYVMSLDHTWLGRSIARPESRYGQIAVDVIRNVATSIGPKDVFHARNRLAGLASDGMADCGPLQRLVAKYLTPEILAAIENTERGASCGSERPTLMRGAQLRGIWVL